MFKERKVWISKGRDLDDKEYSEREKSKKDERDAKREQDRLRDGDYEKSTRELEYDREKENRSKDKTDSERKARAKNRSPRKGSPDSQDSRLKYRQRSRSRSKQRSSSRSRKRSRSPDRDRQAIPYDEESVGDDNFEGEDEELEDTETYSMSGRSSLKRRHRANFDDNGEGEGYEDISSDEEMGMIDDPNVIQALYELEEESAAAQFNYMDFLLVPLTTFRNPCLTNFQINLSKHKTSPLSEKDCIPEAKNILNMIEQFKVEPKTERWVVALEELPRYISTGLSYLVASGRSKEVVEVLTDWVIEASDYENAQNQTDPAFMVRQIKMGINLAAFLADTEEDIAVLLLTKGVMSKLLQLLESDFIVFSIKHLLLRTLSKMARFPAVFQWFLGLHPKQKSSDEESTVYQRLINYVLKKKNVKVTMALTSLLRKIHMFETLGSLYNTVDRIASVASRAIEAEVSAKEGEESPDDAPSLAEDDENSIYAALSEVAKILQNPQEFIGQQANIVPCNLLVENKPKSSEVLHDFFSLANFCGLLESVYVLLSCPMTVVCSSIYLSVHSLLQQLTHTQEGLLYLAFNADTTNSIIRVLLQIVDEQDETVEEMASRQLAIELVYNLQAIQYLDQLTDLNNRNRIAKCVDDPEVISILKSLYTMSFTANNRDPLIGRYIVVKVLSFNGNLDSILAFQEKTVDESTDSQVVKSVTSVYTSQILLIVAKTSTDMDMIEKYSPRILALCEENTPNKINQIQEWLQPTTKVPSYDIDGLPAMISQLKSFADDVKKIPPGLITVMRMIYSLIDVRAQSGDESDKLKEAKYRYVIAELYSAECFPIFINIIQKLSEAQLKIWQQGIPYTSEQWLTFFSLIKPTMSIIHHTLCQLIREHSHNTEPQPVESQSGEAPSDDQEPLIFNPFKDLTSIPVLMELHTVMCSVPTSSMYSNDLTQIQKVVVDTLLSFTHEEFQQTQTDDALSKSLWTMMLKELLKYTVKSPYTYMSGLLALSELLPLPFPLHTKAPLTEEEIESATMARKLWSVHLQASTTELFTVLDTLSGTGCQPLQHLLRRVCWQVADLAAPSSLRITKILMDIVIVNLKPKKPTQAVEGEKKEGEDETVVVRTVSIHTAKTINLLAYLLSHPGIKAALLQLIGSSTQSENKYKEFLPVMLQLLNQTVEGPAEIQAQEGIVSLIQNLCDLEVSMVNTDLPVTLAEHLANSLPESGLLSDITSALLEHIGNSAQYYASILPCLRTLTMLTDHDYGLNHLKINLEKNLTSIHNLLNRINNTFSKDEADCLSTLSTVLELLRLMASIDLVEEMAVTRTKVISRDDLRRYLVWTPETSHPLEELESLIQNLIDPEDSTANDDIPEPLTELDVAKEDKTLKAIHESITSLTSLLRNDSNLQQEGDTNLEEIPLPAPASLNDLFSQRAVYTILETEDDRLSPSYWLANPSADEPDAEPEVLRCDLQAICERHLPDFNLEEELKKETDPVEENLVRPRRPKDRRKSHEAGINIFRGKPGRKPFVAPMRGRGIMSHKMTNRSNDLFRSRAANTSRPPSMHVDDFLKMENNQDDEGMSQQQAPVARPTPPMVMLPGIRPNRDKEPMRGFGFERGRGYGMHAPTRFFNPSGSYSRRDLHHDSHRDASREGMMPQDRRPNFLTPRPVSRGRNDRPPYSMGDRRGLRNARFSPANRGRGHWGRGREMDMGRFGFRGRRDHSFTD